MSGGEMGEESEKRTKVAKKKQNAEKQYRTGIKRKLWFTGCSHTPELVQGPESQGRFLHNSG